MSFLYFFLISCSAGMCDCIFHMEFRCLMNSGTMTSRISTTRMMIVRAQVRPLEVPNGTASTAWMRIITHATASKSGSRMLT